jgi:hypothetical protein
MGIRSSIVVIAGDGMGVEIASYDKTATSELRKQFGWDDGEYSGTRTFDDELISKVREPNEAYFEVLKGDKPAYIARQIAYCNYLEIAMDTFGIEECQRINKAVNNGWKIIFSWG